MDSEEAFQTVGEFGPYQKRAVAVLVFAQVYMACQCMLIVLVGATPEYRIEKQDSDLSSQQEQLQHVIFTEDINTIVTEWFLIKQQAYKVSLAGSLFFAGLLVGNLVFGPLSDKIGRRPVYLTGLFFEVVFGYVTAMAPSYEVFAVSRLLVGLMNGGIGVCGQVLLGHDRYSCKYGICSGHCLVWRSGILYSTMEESGHGSQLIRCPVVPSVCRALHTSMPFTVFCLSGLSAGCLGLLLPETLNKPAAETLDDLNSPTLGRVLESKPLLYEDNQLKSNHNN
ncbi:solute carrier family 22 member 15-like [Parambassis ranga]|uniref:Solute carrier family 22 member 15-like n=1 Tax=Parambassis ranga TaxID=210632 RepID=A0A6P7JP54_9TELE|nr:solute carrier family 22 member 15-like [Parambassis ranga]